jgi:hypothetical protein
MSYRALKVFFQDVLGVVISSRFLAKQVKKAGRTVKGEHKELVERLKGEGHLHIEENGWKENGKERWIWVFLAKRYAVFLIRERCGEVELEEVLGKENEGIITSDFSVRTESFTG